MIFIGRIEEKRKIIENILSNKKEFIAITGKRGVGKTALMLKVKEEISKKYPEFHFLLISGKKKVSTKIQLNHIEQNVLTQLHDNVHFSQWNDFFNYLNQKAKNQKLICFIDEFPWFNVKGGFFVENFAEFWNLLTNDNLKIIITGSAVSWINKNIFRTKGGLYHKTTLKIQLKSFDLIETKKFLINENPHINNNQILEYYLLTGGVVRYLQALRLNRSVKENIAELYNQTYFDDFFENSFNSNKTNIHKSIIKLFDKRISLSIEEIKEKLRNKVSEVLIYQSLQELVETEMLIENKSLFKKEKSKQYVLSDLYCFYFLRMTKFDEKQFRILNGLAFEIMVQKNLHLILASIGRKDFY